MSDIDVRYVRDDDTKVLHSLIVKLAKAWDASECGLDGQFAVTEEDYHGLPWDDIEGFTPEEENTLKALCRNAGIVLTGRVVA